MTTILIVEDMQPVREMLKITLTPEHEVLQAADAAQAIELAEDNRPDLVLLDLNLQGNHDGLEVCRTLRSELDPTLAKTPIVMLTGETNQTSIAAALTAGANAYIGKPFSPLALLALLEEILTR